MLQSSVFVVTARLCGARVWCGSSVRMDATSSARVNHALAPGRPQVTDSMQHIEIQVVITQAACPDAGDRDPAGFDFIAVRGYSYALFASRLLMRYQMCLNLRHKIHGHYDNNQQ